MWARAVEKAGTFDTDKVIAAMEAFDQEPFLVEQEPFQISYIIRIRRHI